MPVPRLPALPHRGCLGLLLPLLLALLLAPPARAGEPAPGRGWLRFADGNTLSGVLLSRNAAGGRVRTDRFGDIDFRDAEARFELEIPPGVAPAPAPAPTGSAPPAPDWQPADLSVGVSGYWQQKDGSTTSNLSLDLGATWRSARHEIRATLAADYKVVDDNVDNNEQSGSLRWLRALHGPWVGLLSVNLERSTFAADPLPDLDYVLVQATAGLGWRQAWSPASETLLALNADRVALDVLSLHRRLTWRPLSLLLENRLRLSPKVRLNHTLRLYRWPGGETGIDSDAELGYDLTDSLRVGLRHEMRRNAVNLDGAQYRRLSLTTRVSF